MLEVRFLGPYFKNKYQLGGCYVTAGRYWSCPCSGVKRDVLHGIDEYTCYRCQTVYKLQILIEQGLTGNEPMHFAEKLNRLFNGE